MSRRPRKRGGAGRTDTSAPPTAAALRLQRLRTLGQALGAAQAAAGLSAEQLGAAAGLSARQVRRVRAGEALGTPALFDLCDALGLELLLLQRGAGVVHLAGPSPPGLLALTRAAAQRLQRALGKLHDDERRAVRLLPAILAKLTPEERRALLGF